MIERYSPSRSPMNLRQMIDRFFEEPFAMLGGGRSTGDIPAALNVYEKDKNLVIEAQLPGIDPEDVEIDVDGDTLIIRAETETEDERQERNYLIREYREGSYVRAVRLPSTVDPAGSKATFDNGMLRLTLPMAQESKRRRVAVSQGERRSRRRQSQDGQSRHEQSPDGGSQANAAQDQQGQEPRRDSAGRAA
ncbi:MAG: hypothetical protein QOF51_146 [Chloroflexota bacterium]|jgi:HSP20 family protein|nr:hypothetical protein [Chloroflexota bacterium]